MNNWIKTTDKLPPLDSGFVLVLANGKPKPNITLVDTYCLADYHMDGWIISEFPEWENPNVTHWMPLPEPPKEELKPCPFCGGNARIQGRGHETNDYRVHCEECGCSTQLWDQTEEKANEKWNRRYEDANIHQSRTPKKPIWIYKDEPLCPNCSEPIDDGFEHCRCCDQRLDWSD